MPDRYAAPAGAVFLKFFDDALGLLGIAEGNHDLVENDVVQDLEAGGGKKKRVSLLFSPLPKG